MDVPYYPCMLRLNQPAVEGNGWVQLQWNSVQKLCTAVDKLAQNEKSRGEKPSGFALVTGLQADRCSV